MDSTAIALCCAVFGFVLAKLFAQYRVRHVCSCGIKYSAQRWDTLPLRGYMSSGNGGILEMRNCACGSTRCLEVK
jgi:hypothetical protein